MLETGQAAWAGLGWAVLLALVGCGDPEVKSQAGQPQGECNAIETSFENGSAGHLPNCSETDYPMSPPVFGDHYQSWAAFQTYDFPVPLGFLVHALEHGAVVFFYDCPDGCADEVSEVSDFIAALPSDPICAAHGVERRAILVPRPGLGARWAAAAWGFSLTADCFDAELFSAFYDQHVGRGPESLCHPGLALTSDPCL